ncbi:MAG: transposase [Deltaproteobacteria bacterium]|nr:transposase [Deltaproteobacteria bacterium]
MVKKLVGWHPQAFRQMAVERLKRCDNILELSRELGVSRGLLYEWRRKMEPTDSGDGPPSESSRESKLRKEVSKLKRVLPDKTVELIFFKGALQKVEARRQLNCHEGY